MMSEITVDNINTFFEVANLISIQQDNFFTDVVWPDVEITADWRNPSLKYHHFLYKFKKQSLGNPLLFLSSLDNGNVSRMVYHIRQIAPDCIKSKINNELFFLGIDFFRWVYNYSPFQFADDIKNIWHSSDYRNSHDYCKFWRHLSSDQRERIINSYENYIIKPDDV